MQKIVLFSLAIFAVALAAPQEEVHILHQHSVVGPEGYQFSFDTSDGTSRQEQGTLKTLDEGHQALTVAGSYRYVAPDGLVYSVTFTADENGFKPQEHVEHQQQ